MELLEEQKKVLADFKAKVKTLPIVERKKAAMLFEIFEQILKIEEEQEKAHDEAFKVYSSAVEKITTEMDLIVEGQRKVNEEEIAFWKQTAEPEFVCKDEDNDSAPFTGFWKGYILNSDICKIIRSWRSRC